MAVQLDEIPSNINFTDNPIICTFYSPSLWAAATTTNYFFKIEIYIGGTSGGGGSLHSTHYKKVESTYDDGVNVRGYGRFDLSQILRTVASASVRNEAEVVGSASYINWSIKVTGEYLLSGTPTIENGSESTEQTSQKGKLTLGDYLLNRDGLGFTTNDSIVTQYPSSENYLVGLSEEVYFNFVSTQIDELQIKLYDINDTLIDSDTYTPATVYDVNQINASPQLLIDETTLTSTDFASAYYYEVEVYNVSTLRNTARFYIDNDCERYENVRLYFVARCGTIEAYTFKMISRQKGDSKVNSSSSIWGAWGAEGAYDESLTIGGSYNQLVAVSETLEVSTDWISEELQAWLIENITVSPYTVIERGGTFENVAVTRKKYEYKKKATQKLIKEEFTFIISNTNSGPLR